MDQTFMNEKNAGIGGMMSSAPWLWILPGTFSLLGLAGLSVATVWSGVLTPVFFLVSVLFLGRAFYLLYWRGNTSRLNSGVVWGSTIISAALWANRFGLF